MIWNWLTLYIPNWLYSTIYPNLFPVSELWVQSSSMLGHELFWDQIWNVCSQMYVYAMDQIRYHSVSALPLCVVIIRVIDCWHPILYNVVVTFITLPTPDVCFFSRVFLRGGNKKSVYKCLISESIFLVSALNLFRQNLYFISQLLYMLSIWLYVLEISIEIIQYRKDGLPGLYCDTLGSNTYSCIGGSEQLLYCHLLYKCVPNSTNAMVYMRWCCLWIHWCDFLIPRYNGEASSRFDHVPQAMRHCYRCSLDFRV